MGIHRAARNRFNTQPPEGGWDNVGDICLGVGCFNTQPPEGGWGNAWDAVGDVAVSTHSRLKAAGCRRKAMARRNIKFQHTAA